MFCRFHIEPAGSFRPTPSRLPPVAHEPPIMLSVDEALQQVLAPAKAKPPTFCPLGEALGLVLAEDIASDVDSPPHDKSLVDGYAVLAADLTGGTVELEIIEEVTAGAVPTRALTGGCAIRIMTGAPIPTGADAVVMVEQTQSLDSRNPLGQVRFAAQRVTPGQNIMRRAASMARGDLALRAGVMIRAVEIGVLSEVGRSEIRVVGRPTLSVLPTGNELVPPNGTPAAGQIRNSNGPMLLAAARAAGAVGIDLGIARDDRGQMRERIARGLESDILVISGGVSAGVLDLVPGVLDELGVRQIFHKVHLKPGKPLWFGALASPAGDRFVFGLPGNPVSSLVCFELFVRPLIGRLAGRNNTALEELAAELSIDFSHRGDRPTYHPARLSTIEGRTRIAPLRWQGSGDLRTLVEANALACFPAGDRAYRAGEMIRVLRLP
jgi:molybdopterin molybdotransferase